jgi:agmatinase
MTKAEKIAAFDPNGIGAADAGLFGLPFTPEDADLVVIPVPWEVTVSYRAGTAQGPDTVLEASAQVDLFDATIPDAWKLGVALDAFDDALATRAAELRTEAEHYIEFLANGEPESQAAAMADVPVRVNAAGHELRAWLKTRATAHLNAGKLVGLIGGDHSTPLGLLDALAVRHPDGFGILQFDAHADLRAAYEGFEFSHASIMYNALKIQQVQKLVQVGLRDICEAEAKLAAESGGRVTMFYDAYLQEEQFNGTPWKKLCKQVVSHLPSLVYISFDIDVLDPRLCPGTGTPVPGGLSFEQAVYLIKQVVKSGRRIIGFDLNEVAPGDDPDWNGAVGARLLYKLCNWMAVSQGRLKTTEF